MSFAKEQIDDILLNAKRLKAFLIIEDTLIGTQEGMRALFKNPIDFDISLYPQPWSILEELLDKDRDVGDCPINGLGAFAYHEKIPYKNIEFRFAQRKSLEGFIKASLFLDSIEKIAKEISLYNDNEILNAYYKEKALGPYLAALSEAHGFFDALRGSGKSVKEALAHVEYKSTYDQVLDLVCKKKISHLLTNENKKLHLISYYDSSLLNARILHTIHEQIKYNAIFVIAGTVHIKDTRPVVEQLGSRQVKTYGTDYTFDEEGKVIHPKPIHIGEFFKEK